MWLHCHIIPYSRDAAALCMWGMWLHCIWGHMIALWGTWSALHEQHMAVTVFMSIVAMNCKRDSMRCYGCDFDCILPLALLEWWHKAGRQHFPSVLQDYLLPFPYFLFIVMQNVQPALSCKQGNRKHWGRFTNPVKYCRHPPATAGIRDNSDQSFNPLDVAINSDCGI